MKDNLDRLARGKRVENFDMISGIEEIRPGAEEAAEELDLPTLLRAILRKFWVFLIVGPVFFGAAVGYFHIAKPKFEASMVIGPASAGRESMPSFAGALTRAKGLLGSLGVQETPDAIDRLKAIIHSRELALKLQDRYRLLQTVYASSWDTDKGEWIKPAGKLFELKEFVKRIMNLPPWSGLTIDDLADFLKNAIKVKSIRETDLVKISIQHPRPELALEVLTKAYYAAEEMMMEKQRVNLVAQLEYLNKQLKKTIISEYRQVLYNRLAQRELDLVMIGKSGYAVEIILKPTVSLRPIKANPILVLGLAVLATFLVSVLIIAGTHSRKASRQRS